MSDQPEKQFDFWLGEWDVSWGEDGKGTNHVLRIMNNKIIQENFSAPNLEGMSVSSYDREREVWYQTWVDNSGSYLDFTGKFENGKMTLVRDAIVRGEACKQRMFGSTSKMISSIGTGTAPMMMEAHGEHCGRSSTRGNNQPVVAMT